ncbi:hypothetical protein [Rhodococcus sp. T2V]|uniref:hypothetical protein n=1 Tax=Rhodococcus sp. T2V TaxID=3034164 RepID=UPI0023E0C89C|nr:hypothetical protein [Rhodococcus sp. T2V]
MEQAAESTPAGAARPGGEFFAAPTEVNHRRYEALRAYLFEGASAAQAAARFGYTPAALTSLARFTHTAAQFSPDSSHGRHQSTLLDIKQSPVPARPGPAISSTEMDRRKVGSDQSSTAAMNARAVGVFSSKVG